MRHDHTDGHIYNADACPGRGGGGGIICFIPITYVVVPCVSAVTPSSPRPVRLRLRLSCDPIRHHTVIFLRTPCTTGHSNSAPRTRSTRLEAWRRCHSTTFWLLRTAFSSSSLTQTQHNIIARAGQRCGLLAVLFRNPGARKFIPSLPLSDSTVHTTM